MTMISELQSIVGENYVTTGKDLAALFQRLGRLV
jgi:hypothetical protein